MEERTRRSIALEDPDAYPNADDAYPAAPCCNSPGSTRPWPRSRRADPDFDALDGFPALLLVLGHTEVARMLRAAEAG